MARQVDLAHVAGNDCHGAEADAGEEHLHLLDGGVLRLIENHVGIVERAAAHIGERRNLDHVALDQLGHLLEAEHLVQRVVQRAQIRIDLLAEITRQEAQLFACLDRGAHQQQALHPVGFQCFDRTGYGQIGLAGAGRAHAEADVVRGDGVQVAGLVGAASLDDATLHLDGHFLGALGGIVGDGVDTRFGQVKIDLGAVERLVLGNGVERTHHLLGRAGCAVLANHLEQVAAMVDLYAQAQLDLAQVLIERAAQVGEPGVVFRLEGEVALVEAVGHGVSTVMWAPPPARRGRLGGGAAVPHDFTPPQPSPASRGGK